MKKKEARFFINRNSNKNEALYLRDAKTTEEARELLEKIFRVERLSKGNPELRAILFDFHIMNLEFAKQRDFSEDKLSTFLDIMNYVLEYSFELRLDRQQSFKAFSTLFLR